MTLPTLVPMHMGPLHGYEAVLLGVLAFGPFVILAFAVLIIRRRDIAAEEEEEGEPGAEKATAARDSDGTNET